MAVPYKKIARKDPRKTDAIEKFYPQLVTLGQSASLESIAYEMKEKSSLSSGDIKSVLTNFVEAMRTSLYNGQSVNIRDFGVFSLSARTKVWMRHNLYRLVKMNRFGLVQQDIWKIK